AGFPTQHPETVDRVTRRLLDKLDRHRAEIEKFEAVDTDDADILVVTFGISARAARRAVRIARAEGIKAGLFRPLTMWPFPEEALRAAAKGAKAVLVPEMNAGQLSWQLERVLRDGTPIVSQGKIDGQPITPDEIVARLREIRGS
ncbi:MAG TPA: transketolase C-terminal domain-containing protein, partial [Kaistiaceae bacterium]|nr:transketolase C-terminal domain-containing protein [Kaistiaceae bacterium]